MREDDGLFIIPDVDELDDTTDLSDARDEVVVPDIPKYLLPDKVYNALKWVTIAAIPWVSWGLGELLPDYGIDPYRVVHALDVIGSILGGLIVGSAVSAMGRKQ